MIHDRSVSPEIAREEEQLSRELVAAHEAYSQQELEASSLQGNTGYSVQGPDSQLVEVRLETPLPKNVESTLSEISLELPLAEPGWDAPEFRSDADIEPATPMLFNEPVAFEPDNLIDPLQARSATTEVFYKEVDSQRTKEVAVEKDNAVAIEPTQEEAKEEGQQEEKGQVLSVFLHKEGKLPSVDWTLELFQQLCQSIQPFHEREVFHWQLTTEKVELLELPQVTQIDGLKTEKEEKESKKKAKDSANMPTDEPAVAAISAETSMYCAPEVGQGAAPDVRSDVYSLAAIFYEVLTGNSIASPLAFAEKDERFKDYEWNNLQVVLRRALSENPEERYESVEAFWDDILEARRNPEDEPPSALEAATEKVKTKMGKHVRKFVTKQAQKRVGKWMMSGGGGGMGGGSSVADEIVAVMVKEMFGSAMKAGSSAVTGAIDKKITAAKTVQDSWAKRIFTLLKKSVLVVGMMLGMMVATSVKSFKVFSSPPAKTTTQVQHQTKVINGKIVKVQVKKKKKKKLPMTLRMWRSFQQFVNPELHRKRKRILSPRRELLQPMQDKQFPL